MLTQSNDVCWDSMKGVWNHDAVGDTRLPFCVDSFCIRCGIELQSQMPLGDSLPHWTTPSSNEESPFVDDDSPSWSLSNCMLSVVIGCPKSCLNFPVFDMSDIVLHSISLNSDIDNHCSCNRRNSLALRLVPLSGNYHAFAATLDFQYNACSRTEIFESECDSEFEFRWN